MLCGCWPGALHCKVSSLFLLINSTKNLLGAEHCAGGRRGRDPPHLPLRNSQSRAGGRHRPPPPQPTPSLISNPSCSIPFCFAGCTAWHVGSYFPDQGSNPRPLYWKAESQPLDRQGTAPAAASSFLNLDPCRLFSASVPLLSV